MKRALPPTDILQSVASLGRSFRIVERNLLVYKYDWMVIFSGYFEPVFYLLSIGLGVGIMIPDVDGVSYPAYVAPGLLASTCMNGAIADGFFNVFVKLHQKRTYDAVLATPMSVSDVVLGEVLWALTRGTMYALLFLVTAVALQPAIGKPLILSRWGIVAVPAAVLVAYALSSVAVCLTSVARSIEDFDAVDGFVVMPMFLFSGVFFPVAHLPALMRWLAQVLPLYHAVELLRQLTTGAATSGTWLHVLYLIVVGSAASAVAARRLERQLCR